MKTTYSYIALAKGLPVCLTVMIPGCPTIALAGAPAADQPASAGGVKEFVWTVRDDGTAEDHSMRVTNERGEVIVVFGHGKPEFGSDKLEKS